MTTHTASRARQSRRGGDENRGRLLRIIQSRDSAGMAPATQRDLATALGLSLSAVQWHVRCLRDAGELAPAGPTRRWGVMLARKPETRHGQP